MSELITESISEKESNYADIIKNYHIAIMADNLKKVANERKNSNFGISNEIARSTLNYKKKSANLNDPDIKRLYKIYCNCL